jgi:HSP20 family protein
MRKYLNNANNVDNASLARRSNAALQNARAPFSLGTGLFEDLYDLHNLPPLLASPFQVMERMQQDMDRLFSHVIGNADDGQWRSGALTPPLTSTLTPPVSLLSPTVDVSETEKEYQIELDLPGVSQDAIDITVVEGILSIRAQMGSQSRSTPDNTPEADGPKEQNQRQYHYRERRWGSFERVFHLPPDAQEDDIRADFTNGVLTLTIAKKAPQALQTRGRRIEIGSDNVEGKGTSQIEAKAESKEGVAA